MGYMNAIQKVERKLRASLDNVVTAMDEPEDKEAGTWWLDVTLAKQHLTIKWNRRFGFGLSAPEVAGYGEGADEVMATGAELVERVLYLLARNEKPQPPDAVLLRRLREIRSVSQQELAKRLGISQATVSKIERRSDMYISTLRRLLEAIGGELEIQARFPDRAPVKIRQFTDLEQPSPPAAETSQRRPKGKRK